MSLRYVCAQRDCSSTKFSKDWYCSKHASIFCSYRNSDNDRCHRKAKMGAYCRKHLKKVERTVMRQEFDELKRVVEYLECKVEDQQKEINKLEDKLLETWQMIDFGPGSSCYRDAKDDFTKLSKQK